MKIGLIARCERARGLAIQSRNFYRNMPVDRVLLVRMPNPDCEERPDWYPGATHTPSLQGHHLHRDVVEQWMDGLDVVFSVETPYDWDLPAWARRMGVKTVIQGNPEFVRHGQPDYEHFVHPDEWWWPTSWRLDMLPSGPVMPVPMPDMEPLTSSPAEDAPLRAFHVTGKRAFADRNGTDIVINALRALDRDVEFTMFGLDHCLPSIDLPLGSGPKLTVRNAGVEDLWEMYDGQHLLVLPRRYAGLCLPALEASAAGCAVLMTDCSPNRELASLFVAPVGGRKIRVAAGEIVTSDVNHIDLAMVINQLNRNRTLLRSAMDASYRMPRRWSEMRGVYLQRFERLCS